LQLEGYAAVLEDVAGVDVALGRVGVVGRHLVRGDLIVVEGDSNPGVVVEVGADEHRGLADGVVGAPPHHHLDVVDARDGGGPDAAGVL